MKKVQEKIKLLVLALSLIFVCSGFFTFKKGDCSTSKMTATAVDQLKKFTMIQEFPFYMKKKKKDAETEYKKQIITLNRGVRYKFFAVRNAEYEGQPILCIYNNEKQEFLLGSTYNVTFKKFYNELEFECKTTGNYCLSFSFLDGMEGCALGVFSSLVKE
ncbi:hypothetical protein CNR22_18995 [Sphingobacteriaceae bacterium]|nr:hypothetical protein CNR22_18995 [Sphingobacteriaceae bacterium]